jgi:hypothetical protein
MGEVKHIKNARERRRLAEASSGVEHRQRVISIAWDPTAEWHLDDGSSGVGLWAVYAGHSTVPYARQVDLRRALHYANEVFRDRVWCETCARFVFASPAGACRICQGEVEHIWVVGEWKPT